MVAQRLRSLADRNAVSPSLLVTTAIRPAAMAKATTINRCRSGGTSGTRVTRGMGISALGGVSAIARQRCIRRHVGRSGRQSIQLAGQQELGPQQYRQDAVIEDRGLVQMHHVKPVG